MSFPPSQPQQPTGYSGLNPDQINMVNQVGYYMDPSAVLPNTPSGQPQQWQQPPGYSNLNPSQIQAVNQQGFYTDPSAVQPQSLWQKLMGGIGQLGNALGTQPGAPRGPTATPGGGNPVPPATPIPLPQGQMQAPPGMGAYFRAQQFPTAAAGGNSGLMQQYLALQQLMRGS